MKNLTRRDFVRKTALVAAAAQFASTLRASVASSAPAPAATTGLVSIKAALKPGIAPLRWLDGVAPAVRPGVTWGVAWPQGTQAAGTSFGLRADTGADVPVQSWPLAFWPDGSLKWTGHAMGGDAPAAVGFELSAGRPAAPTRALSAVESAGDIVIDTGLIQARVAKSGNILVPIVQREGRDTLTHGRLVLLKQNQPELAAEVETFDGEIGAVKLEQSGPVRAVVKITGKHRRAGRAWLPFVVRLYFYAGSEAVRVVHTIIHDGDEQKDFIRGLGLRFEVPLRGELHDRHVRFSGQGKGLFGEAVRGLTGLRRDPGQAVRDAQVAGLATPAVSSWDKRVSSRLHYVPAYNDWTLFQSSADGFEIRKRTKEGFTWVSAARGQRAGGLGYVGTPQGGVAFGLRNFWQSHPAQLDIRHATTDRAEVTLWLWAPDAGPMDLRGYHDAMGMEDFDQQLEGLEITYEDYEPGYDKPEGVARTSEIFLWVETATPTRDRLASLAGVTVAPPVLVPQSDYLHGCGVFGNLWAPADRSTPAKAALEDQIDWHFDFYEKQREERRWYGFWNYGDVMHSYDRDRHEWKYDIGGFAWDNSELSTDLWLWSAFLRSGRADIFRFAEAMTRHTGEVDVHHIGRFAPLGSRHNVLHWGCSAKQLRISNAANRRYYYYLTADERVGDLMREQIEAGRALATVQANRKVARDRVTAPDPNATDVYAGFGTDWGSLAAAWLTEWERTGDPKMKARLIDSMKSIAAQPRGFFTGGAKLNLQTGAFARETGDRVSVSHLSAVFGLVEVCAELIQLLDVPEFKQAWLEYCYFYSATPEEQVKKFGAALRGTSLRQGHSRLTAYAAKMKGDPALAKRAWAEFQGGDNVDFNGQTRPKAVVIEGPAVLRPVEEAAFVSTNGTAQWGLAVIQCLALIGEELPEA